MNASVHKTAPFGEVIAAAFDKAARYSTDPKEISRLATGALALILRLSRRRTTSSFSPWIALGLRDLL